MAKSIQKPIPIEGKDAKNVPDPNCKHGEWEVGFRIPKDERSQLSFMIRCKKCLKIIHDLPQAEIAHVLGQYCMGKHFNFHPNK